MLWVILATAGAVTASGQDIERDPIHYSTATPRNVVTRLQDRLAAGRAKLVFEPDRGYLRSVLRELDVPESSQILVFSKTSLQRDRISPRTPRAIYFNDDVMVGFCLRGPVLEISTADDALGTTFYTLAQDRDAKPVPERQTESCLTCHASPHSRQFGTRCTQCHSTASFKQVARFDRLVIPKRRQAFGEQTRRFRNKISRRI